MMKRKLSAQKALELVAKKNHTTVSEVRREIEHAILQAVGSDDPHLQAVWSLIPCAGDIPTPEEVIAYIVSQIDPYP